MLARCNPFRVQQLESIRYRMDEDGWEELFRHLEQLQFEGAIVGPEGSGKTTLLEELGDRFIESGWPVVRLQLTRERRRLDRRRLRELRARLTPRHIILFDGAEQLNAVAWRVAYHSLSPRRGLIITVHRPCRLPTLLECRTTPELLEDIVSELLGDRPAAWRPLIGSLFHRHNGNIRNALREWYDWCAQDRFPWEEDAAVFSDSRSVDGPGIPK